MTGIVTRENPIRRATCNPAGAGFDRIVEIWPDPDSRIGYPSILNKDDNYDDDNNINYDDNNDGSMNSRSAGKR